MSTDPKEFPAADSHTGQREIDPVTGYDTTGHEWGGIKELNTPFPRIALIALFLTVAYSLVSWVLLPAWPIGRDYTRGLLGLDQGQVAIERYRDLASTREEWLSRFETPDFTTLSEDAALMATAMPAAARLFRDNCAVCHGETGSGGIEFPVLNDGHWLWGGEPDMIAETLRVGINSSHPDSRWAQMPSFDWMDRTDRIALAHYVAKLPENGATTDDPGADLFAQNCAACHGDGGVGGLLNGAPSLVDGAVIYGQDIHTVMNTLRGGRQGVMPSWAGRLSGAEINLLALYVMRLQDRRGGGQS